MQAKRASLSFYSRQRWLGCPPRVQPLLHLEAMPQPIIQLLKESLSHVTLSQGLVCIDAGDAIEQVYFPTSGLISLVIPSGEGELVEVGLVGREGAVGLQITFGRRLLFARAIVQMTGAFYKIPAEPLRRAVETSEEAKALVYRYIETRLAEAHQLGACNAIHDGAKRLAGWLLRSADRTGSNQLSLTQEFLGEMLGLRRTTVTLLAQHLQDRGIIKYSRGKISILDRDALQGCACDCYRVIRGLPQYVA
jgi:CRP-like cAMP-binding protein